MKSFAGFAGVSVLLIAATAGVFALVYRAPADRRAVGVSAGLALAVQCIAFVIVRRTSRENVMAGWGLGVILRFLVLGVYALVIVKALGLPSGTAMLSLAVFFFLSTLVEPLFLNR